MTLEFLSPHSARSENGRRPVARSPIERCLRAAGARFEVRDGWSVATSFGSPDAEWDACRTRAGVADRSALGKLEIQAPADVLPASVAEVAQGAELRLGEAASAADAWWCPVTAERALVLTATERTRGLHERLRAEAKARGANVVDVTTTLGALAVLGPRARDLLARLTALDLRPHSMPEGGFRPGSVARTPAMVLRERGDCFLVLFGAAYGEYVWAAVTDAGEPLGAALVGEEALARA